MQEKWEKISLL